MKILVATEKPFAPVAVSQIREVIDNSGHQLVLLENYKTVPELLGAVADADALIVRSDLVTPEVLAAAKKLKVVVRAGAGYDNIDTDACTTHGVIVMNTPGQNSNGVAELVFEMLLYYARSGFAGKSGYELRGKSIGLHAYGNVSKYVAEIAKGFGMEIYAFDPFVSEATMKEAGIIPVFSPEELYSKCRFISLHIPLNEKTKNSIGYDLLKNLPHEAVIVNAARKEVIDDEGLIKLFSERTDIAYLSDGEPDCKSIFEERFKGRYIFTTKKMGAQTEEANIKAGVAAAKQIVDYFATGNEKFRVNKKN